MMAERRLIDACGLVEKLQLRGLAAIFAHDDGTLNGLRAALFEIAYSPTIDAVPVVRCKDCDYATVKDGDLYCDGPIGIFGTVGFNDFCSFGERKRQ